VRLIFIVGCGPHEYRPHGRKLFIYQLQGESINIFVPGSNETLGFDGISWTVSGGSPNVQQLEAGRPHEFRFKINRLSKSSQGIKLRTNITRNYTSQLGRRINVNIGEIPRIHLFREHKCESSLNICGSLTGTPNPELHLYPKDNLTLTSNSSWFCLKFFESPTKTTRFC
jgi:hypothetical protein